MKLEIISPDTLVYSGEVEKVILPGTAGSFEVLPRHAALISSLKEGDLIYDVAGSRNVIKVNGGFAEIKNNSVSVCVERVLG